MELRDKVNTVSEGLTLTATCRIRVQFDGNLVNTHVALFMRIVAQATNVHGHMYNFTFPAYVAQMTKESEKEGPK